MGPESSVVAQLCVRGSSVMRCDARGFDPLSGVPCFPFYGPRESTSYSGRREENQRGRKSFIVAWPFFSFVRVLSTLQAVIGTAPCRRPVCR